MKNPTKIKWIVTVMLLMAFLTGCSGGSGSSTTLILGVGSPSAAPTNLWAWGDAYYGELGRGTFTNSSIPVQGSGLSNIISIAAGGLHSLALKSDGTVWAWGDNTYGELGNGTNGPSTNSSSPVQVTGLTTIIAVAAGGAHNLALKSDGTVWAWGHNNNGQLGNGSTTDRFTSVQVSGLTNITAIAAGDSHSLALRSDGTVWAWGNNLYGQLGNGTTTNSSTPVQVTGLANISVIAAGGLHSLALLNTNGSVWAWGYNAVGQLGDGTTTNSSTPVQVTGLTNIRAIAGGGSHSLAILNTDGSVWAWGNNGFGQLGNGTTTRSATPVQVTGLTNIRTIAAGAYHSLAILNTDGTIRAWGNNVFGQLGNNTTTNSSTPVQVTGLNTIIGIAAGYYHSLAIL